MSLGHALLIGIFSGCIWSTVMDSAFPRMFDPLPKPFGCSKCMAFWSALAAAAIHSYLWHDISGSIPIFALIGAGAVAHVTAAFASRKFRGL